MKNVEITKHSLVLSTGVAGVPVAGCYVQRPWTGHVVGGLLVAPTATSSLKQDSVRMTPAVDAAPRKDAFARSGIRTEGPPV